MRSLLCTLCILAVLSCDRPMPDDCTTYDYSDCITTASDTGKLTVKVTINPENKEVPVLIYLGPVEDNQLIITDTLYEVLAHYYLPVNTAYSVEAIYHSGNKKILAISGDQIVLKAYHVCDSICYVIRNAIVDVRLKKDLR